MPAERVAADDLRLADFRALNDPARRRAIERRGDIFIAEGLLVLEHLLASGHHVRTVMAAESALERVTAIVDDAPVEVLVVDDRDVAAIAGFAFHRGVLASADRPALRPIADVVGDARLVLVAEGVNDHENVGALFRNAAALGGEAVVLDPTTADPLYRRSVRVSMGHVLRVPWARAARWPGDLDVLRAHGFELVALTPAPDAASLGDLEDIAARRVALLVGAEGPGLSRAALAAADRRLRIDIEAAADSLNVATAAAIALHALRGVRR